MRWVDWESRCRFVIFLRHAGDGAVRLLRQVARISRTKRAVCPIWSLNRWYMPTRMASLGLIPFRAAAMRSLTCRGEFTVRPAARTLYVRQGLRVLRITAIIFGGSEGR